MLQVIWASFFISHCHQCHIITNNITITFDPKAIWWKWHSLYVKARVCVFVVLLPHNLTKSFLDLFSLLLPFQKIKLPLAQKLPPKIMIDREAWGRMGNHSFPCLAPILCISSSLVAEFPLCVLWGCMMRTVTLEQECEREVGQASAPRIELPNLGQERWLLCLDFSFCVRKTILSLSITHEDFQWLSNRSVSSKRLQPRLITGAFFFSCINVSNGVEH